MCCLGESNKLLNTPPITAPAIPPSKGDSGKGRVLEIDAPIVAKEADAATPVPAEPFTC